MSACLLSTKEFVEKYELMAKKSLGQNFLLDHNITDKIVRLSMQEQQISSLKEENFLEVGPGPGGLTQAVLRQNPQSLTAIEMDERCLNILAEIKKSYPQLQIINGDALLYDYAKKAQADGRFHIISNLPYNISVPLLTSWLKQIQCFKSLTLMFQKEVGERILAQSSNKEYGRLSVISQLQCQVVKLFDLPPTCFVPAPKIWSSVLLFMPKEKTLSVELFEEIEKLTGLAFSMRRKMIRQSLKNIPNIGQIFEELNIAPTLRAEDLSPEDYLRIAKRLRGI